MTKDEESTRLALLITRRRNYLGYTQRKLARRVGVSAGHIQHIEQGCCYSIFQRINALAIALKMSPRSLLEAAWEDANGTPLPVRGKRKKQGDQA